jgi:DNA-binding NtrC family response regulator
MANCAGEHVLLIVDDDDGMRDTLLDILEEEGYRVALAEDGLTALDAIKSARFDLVLMDIVMPRMNGVEVLKHVKSIDEDVLVIMMTAYAGNDLIEQAMELGAYRVLRKPLDVTEVLSLIREAIGCCSGVREAASL